MEIKAKSFVLSSRLKKTCWVLLVVSVIVFAVSLLLALRYKSTMPELEHTIFSSINDLPDSLRTAAIVATTALGSVWAFVGVSIVVTVLKAYRLAWWLALSVFITYLLSAATKVLVDRPRPPSLINDTVIRATESTNGFPSGHTALATILSLTLFFYLPKGWRWTIVVFWIGITAFTRLYLGVHSPLDIVGGAALGAGVFAALRLLPKKIQIVLRLTDKQGKSK